MSRKSRPVHTDADPVDNYLGSVSDLMAALTFVFILTVAVFALRLSQQQEKEEERLDRIRKDRSEMLIAIRERLKGMQVEIDATQGVLRIGEQDGIFFDSGQPEPAAKDHRNVGRVARALAEVLPAYVYTCDTAPDSTQRPTYCAPLAIRPACGTEEAKVETLLIEGHTDIHAIRGGSNMALSSARAEQVFEMMSKCEPSLNALQNSMPRPVLGVSGYGERRPVAVDSTDDQNRRIDLRFLLELPDVGERRQLAPAEDVSERLEKE